MEIAVLGLGRMGMQIALRLHQAKFEVKAWNRGEEPREAFGNAGGTAFATAEELVASMQSEQRVFWVMLPNTIVDEFLFGEQGFAKLLKPGDIVIDGGNSFYKDTQRRNAEFAKLGISFYDCGTSGGVHGLERGFAVMVGGPKEQWSIIEPIFKTLSTPDANNYGLVGASGAGHFVKMVHNGIEYGMMEAIAEGYAVMHASEFDLDLKQVSTIYQSGSVISSWLIDLTKNIYEHPETIESTSGAIDATGEGEWTINEAKRLGIDVRVIEDSLKVRTESKDPVNKDKYSNKIVALLRQQFGGHKITKK
jgi:6-phosphogluconate dehydrogenase